MMTTLFKRHPRACVLARRSLGAVLFSVALTAAASPWDEMTTGLFNEAHAAFSKEEKAPGADLRSLRFGEAVSLLNVQPRTSSNIDRAYAILEELRTATPGDDIGMESRYFQGRIEQVQRPTPDLAKAEAIFSELVRDHPEKLVGQRARVKLAVTRLYAPVSPAERRDRYDAFTRDAGQITDPGIKVQMHLLLGEAARRLQYGNAEELAHLLAAYEAGVTKRRLLVEVLVRIGDLARLEGRKDVAIKYYTLFLEQFPRTDRRSTVEGFLVELNKKS
ncbi:hypothetical protein [Rariglobus hedericola]|uniref:Tetratricopeptide repeat protein n=1 Tax=Rariglobus hedericola TaxID=2597822 RepID=A0A556QEQ2_9BACT|nr:hypothetical protein [Rariglobus hedericola]TSJ75091.1 hypothetical protein FPL22_16980 [Rariglobus hedericola]